MLDSVRRKNEEENPDIAIIGMSCRFPGANTPEAFWTNLENGVESIRRFTAEELIEQSNLPNELVTNSNFVPASGFVDNIELFDNEFFGFSLREAEILDPQHKLLFECVWEALENAGYDSFNYKDKIGIYVGCGMSLYSGSRMNSYFSLHTSSQEDLISSLEGPQVIIANKSDYLATKISYKFNLRGPSINVQTACSTSLVAVHIACQSILNNECSMALAGASAVHLPLKTGYIYYEGGMFSSDGHCRTFDAKADGVVGGNGAAIILLKRLSHAVKDGDFIHAVIKGSSINNDGNSKVSYMAPSIDGQVEVVSQAINKAEIPYETVRFIEAHGTGTKLGDPIEVAALSQAFSKQTSKKQFCALGAVKTNIGHLDTASGMAGLIKTVLSLKNQKIPATLHFQNPNPNIDFPSTPFYVNSNTIEWRKEDYPRRAGVSSLGAGGTNAHVILEEFITTDELLEKVDDQEQIICLSAKTEEALKALAEKYISELSEKNINLNNLAYTSCVGRFHFEKKLFFIESSVEGFLNSLKEFVKNDDEPKISFNQRKMHLSNMKAGFAFLFTGQGSQYKGMGSELYKNNLYFSKLIDECDVHFKNFSQCSLVDIMFSSSNELINETLYTQPALFVLEYALAKLWIYWGVNPSIVMGHSVGEYVAACIAGVFSLEDGIKLIVHRARFMNDLCNQGRMIAIFASKNSLDFIFEQYQDQISLAAINSPENLVLSGGSEIIEAIGTQLQNQNIEFRILNVSRAFHSHLMEPALEEFGKVVSEVNFHLPTIPIVSNVTGKEAYFELTDPQYWVNHLRSAVQFEKGVNTLFNLGFSRFIEIGPKKTLAPLAQLCCSAIPENTLWFQSLAKDRPYKTILDNLGRIYLSYGGINWENFYKSNNGIYRRTPLPTYPFQKTRCWLDIKNSNDIKPHSPILKLNEEQLSNVYGVLKSTLGEEKAETVLQALKQSGMQKEISNKGSLNFKEGFCDLKWKKKLSRKNHSYVSSSDKKEITLIFSNNNTAEDSLINFLESKQKKYLRIYKGVDFRKNAEKEWQINEKNFFDYEEILESIKSIYPLYKIVCLYLWGMDGFKGSSYIPNCLGLLYLYQAIVKKELTEVCSIRIFTSNAYSINYDGKNINPFQATMWGMIRTLFHELPEIDQTITDVQEEDYASENSLQRIYERDPEFFQVIIKNGDMYVPFIEKEDVSQQNCADSLNSCASYLVTGGTGGLGPFIIKWLCDLGAKHIILVSRKEFSFEFWQTIDEFVSKGVRFYFWPVDVSDYSQLSSYFLKFPEKIPPLKGIIHLAGVLRDSFLMNTNADHFYEVLKPKMIGGWNLHLLTQEMDLNFFIAFSSIASVFGSSGQANYAAGNAFLDSLMSYRNNLGLPGLSINWGPWSKVGMATYNNSQVIEEKSKNIEKIEPLIGVKILTALLTATSAQKIVLFLSSEFSHFFNFTKDSHELTKLSNEIWNTIDRNISHECFNFVTHLKQVSPEEAENLLGIYLQEKITNILGIKIDSFKKEEGFQDLGMDSMMGLQFRNVLSSELSLSLPSTLIYKYPNLYELQKFLREELYSFEKNIEGKGEENLLNLNQRTLSELAELLTEELMSQ